MVAISRTNFPHQTKFVENPYWKTLSITCKKLSKQEFSLEANKYAKNCWKSIAKFQRKNETMQSEWKINCEIPIYTERQTIIKIIKNIVNIIFRN